MSKHEQENSTTDWEWAHTTAMTYPNSVEAPFVALVSSIDQLIERHGDDHVLREGIAHLIMGTQRLLNAETGRLDCGSLDRTLTVMAQRIGFDLDRQVFSS